MTKFTINYLFSELMGSNLFNECPLGLISIRNMDKEVIVREYLDGIEYEDTTLYKEKAERFYPESKHKGKIRAEKMVKKMSEKYKESSKKVAHIAITHGFFVNKFALHLNGR